MDKKVMTILQIVVGIVCCLAAGKYFLNKDYLFAGLFFAMGIIPIIRMFIDMKGK